MTENAVVPILVIMKKTATKPREILVLEKFMKENALTRKDLEKQLGSRSRVSEVLGGKRQLSIAMLKNLVNNWGMDANELLREPANKSAHATADSEKGESIVWMLD